MKNCLVIIGEKSGEEHAASFWPQLVDSQINFFGVAGDQLVDIEKVYHLKDFSTMGFSEAIRRLPFYKRAFNNIINEVQKRQCKHAVLVDFQGFNLRLAQKLKELGVEVHYYVAPQAWAWKAGRAATLRDCVERLYCILPFEQKWFRDHGVKQALFVGHPLSYKYKKININTRECARKLLLLPGSRSSEVDRLLPVFQQVAIELKSKHGFEIGIVQSDSVKWKDNFSYDYTWSADQIEQAMSWSSVALAASGTVTLTLGLNIIPTVVAYKLSLFNKIIARLLISYKGFISLTNIVAKKEIFPEYLNNDVCTENLVTEILHITQTPQQYQLKIDQLKEVRSLMENPGVNVGELIKKSILGEGREEAN